MAPELSTKGAKIEELITSLSDAEAAKSYAQTSLANLQDQMEGLQKVLETFQQDAAEKETSHANGLAKLRKELKMTAIPKSGACKTTIQE